MSRKVESKGTALTHASQKPDGVLKLQKENLPRKLVAPNVHKGLSTRYGQQAELKEQNQLLIATNEELKKTLEKAQKRVDELGLQCKELKKENADAQKTLKDCHRLLVAAKIDPVQGQRVAETAQQTEEQRKELMCVSTDLLHELNAFKDIASQQRVKLEEVQSTISELALAREQMAQERENFSLEAAEMEQALKEAEALLM